MLKSRVLARWACEQVVHDTSCGDSIYTGNRSGQGPAYLVSADLYPCQLRERVRDSCCKRRYVEKRSCPA
jgi:hypothetical protein